MYTCYVRVKDTNVSSHLGKLFADFNKACDSLDEAIRMLHGNDFKPPNRDHIMGMMEHRGRAVYFVSEKTGDRFVICDLPVIY